MRDGLICGQPRIFVETGNIQFAAPCMIKHSMMKNNCRNHLHSEFCLQQPECHSVQQRFQEQ